MIVEKNVVLNGTKNGLKFIDEKSYQQVKKELCKTDDYFTFEELRKLAKF